MAEYQSTEMLNVPASSLASQLPQVYVLPEKLQKFKALLRHVLRIQADLHVELARLCRVF
jgi:hypothetical protein